MTQLSIQPAAIFETGIVELAVKRATEQDIAEIEAALKKWGTIGRDSDDPDSPDQAFHLSIAKATRNVLLVNRVQCAHRTHGARQEHSSNTA